MLNTLHRCIPVALIALALCSAARAAHAGSELEAEQRADLRERLGARVGASLQFSDQDGARVELGKFFGPGAVPVVLTLNYFHCPMLCDVQLERLGSDLRYLARDAQLRFRALSVSIDPHDAAQDARAKRTQLMPKGRAGFDWSFLVGDAGQVLGLARAVGASYAYDKRTGQYDHIPAVFVLAPDGRIVRYLYGLDVGPRDLRLALLDASAGRIGTSVDKILLRCFRYDAASGKYSLYVLGAVRASSGLLLLAMAFAFFRSWRRVHARGAAS
jgi:protein SCO1/2